MNRSWETDGMDPPPPSAVGIDVIPWEAGRLKGQQQVLLQRDADVDVAAAASAKRGREKKRSQSHKKKQSKAAGKQVATVAGEGDQRATSASPSRAHTQSRSRQRSLSALKTNQQQLGVNSGQKTSKAARAEELQAARHQEKLAQAQLQSEMARQKSEGHMKKGLLKELERERVFRAELERRLQDVYSENQSYHLHLVAMQQEYRRMEEVVRSLLQYKGRLERSQDERKNMVIKYENTIQKQKTQLSNLEDENKLMQAEVKRMESQCATCISCSKNISFRSASMPLQVIPLKSGADMVQHCDDGEKSKVLLERLKMLEMEKSGLVLENEALQQQYDHCLDDIANQVISALLAQKTLREECLRLQKHVLSLEDQNRQLHDAFKHSMCTSPSIMTSSTGNGDSRASPNKDLNGVNCDLSTISFGSLHSMWSTSQEHCDQFPGLPRLSSPPPWMKDRLGLGNSASPSMSSAPLSGFLVPPSHVTSMKTPAADYDSGAAPDISTAITSSVDNGIESDDKASNVLSKRETEIPMEIPTSPRLQQQQQQHVGVVYQHHDYPSSSAKPRVNTDKPKPSFASRVTVLNNNSKEGSPGRRLLSMADGFSEKFVVDRSSGQLLCGSKSDMYSKRPTSHLYSLTSMMSLNDFLDRGANRADDNFSMADMDMDMNVGDDDEDNNGVATACQRDQRQTVRGDQAMTRSLDQLDSDSEDTTVHSIVTAREDSVDGGLNEDEEVFATRGACDLPRPKSASDISRLKLSSSMSECQRLGIDDPAIRQLLAGARKKRTKSDDNLLRTTVCSTKQTRKSGSELRKFFAKIRPSFHSKSTSPTKTPGDSTERDDDKQQPAKKQRFQLFRRSSRKSKSSGTLQDNSCGSSSTVNTPAAAGRKKLALLSPTEDTARSTVHDDGYHSNSTVFTASSSDRVATRLERSNDKMSNMSASSSTRRSLVFPEPARQPAVGASSSESLERIIPCKSGRSSRSGTLTPDYASMASTRQWALSCTLPKSSSAGHGLLRLTVSMSDIDNRALSQGEASMQHTFTSLLDFHARLQTTWQRYSCVSSEALKEQSTACLCSPDVLNDIPDMRWLVWSSDSDSEDGRATVSEMWEGREAPAVPPAEWTPTPCHTKGGSVSKRLPGLKSALLHMRPSAGCVPLTARRGDCCVPAIVMTQACTSPEYSAAAAAAAEVHVRRSRRHQREHRQNNGPTSTIGASQDVIDDSVELERLTAIRHYVGKTPGSQQQPRHSRDSKMTGEQVIPLVTNSDRDQVKRQLADAQVKGTPSTGIQEPQRRAVGKSTCGANGQSMAGPTPSSCRSKTSSDGSHSALSPSALYDSVHLDVLALSPSAQYS